MLYFSNQGDSNRGGPEVDSGHVPDVEQWKRSWVLFYPHHALHGVSHAHQSYIHDALRKQPCSSRVHHTGGPLLMPNTKVEARRRLNLDSALVDRGGFKTPIKGTKRKHDFSSPSPKKCKYSCTARIFIIVKGFKSWKTLVIDCSTPDSWSGFRIVICLDA